MSLDLPALANLEWLLRDGAEPSGLDVASERMVATQAIAECGIAPSAARRAADDDRRFRSTLALRWLEAVEQSRRDLPGAWIERGLSAAWWILVLTGAIAGIGAAKALLAYDGSVPVNVLPFVAFFFLLQIVLLVAMLLFMARARRPGNGPGLLHRPIAWLLRRFGGKGHDVAEVLRSLHARHALYNAVERWRLFALAQWFGVAFNAGALLAALHTIVFSDLVFAWSTTLHIEAATVAAVGRWFSLPWSWYPDAVPGLSVVTASQWVRMPGAFVERSPTVANVALAAEWWRFLVAGLITYGLLPRLLALLSGRWLSSRALAAVSFDHAGYQDLFDRLLPHGSGWEGPDPGAVVGVAPLAGRGQATVHAPAVAGRSVTVVAWGSLGKNPDATAAIVARCQGAAVQGVVLAGGAALAADDAAIAALTGQSAARISFVVAAGHQPTADVRNFLRRLRTAVGAARPIVVNLIELASDGSYSDVEDDERAAWKRALGALDDPYLWVEAMGVAR